MKTSAECRAMSDAAGTNAANAEGRSRVHFGLMAVEWRKVAIMAAWQEEMEVDLMGRRPPERPSAG